MKQALVDLAAENKEDGLLEAAFVIRANDEFHKIADRVKERKGKLDSKDILFEYKDWLKREVKKRRI